MNQKTEHPTKFLFISLDGLAGDLAWQIRKEGHEVKYFIKSPEEKEVSDGFVEKIDNWKEYVDWADVIIFDDVLGQGKIAADLRKKGKAVIGGSEYTDRLEDDRDFGQDELKKHGVSTVAHRTFTSFDEAIAFVKENPGKYVIKPTGDGSPHKGLLFVGDEDDGRDVIQVLSDYKKAWEKRIPHLQLQKRIQGVEIAVGAFFNGKKFIHPININFEHKKLFPGNLGPSTGEMGTMMFWSSPNKIFNQTLAKFESTLAREGYAGYIDINCIVNGSGIYPLEFTSRFGYPTISIQQESMTVPVGKFMLDLARGENVELKVRSGFQIGVRIVVPPFPFADSDKKTFTALSKDSVVYFSKPDKFDGIHIEDVKLVNDEWVVTGTVGVVLIVCGMGQSVKQAQEQAYKRIAGINIPHMYYRTDIGDRWQEDSDKLLSWGYLRES